MDSEAEQRLIDKPWLFKPGVSGNPSGKPKGCVSLKTYAQKMLREMDEDERMDFLKGLDKKVIWEMAEGKPDTKSEVKGDVDLIFKWADEPSNNDTV